MNIIMFFLTYRNINFIEVLSKTVTITSYYSCNSYLLISGNHWLVNDLEKAENKFMVTFEWERNNVWPSEAALWKLGTKLASNRFNTCTN